MNLENKSTIARVGSYKGNPTISLNADAKYPFTFGLAKARLILAHLADIEKFAAHAAAPQPEDRFDLDAEDRMSTASYGR